MGSDAVVDTLSSIISLFCFLRAKIGIIPETCKNIAFFLRFLAGQNKLLRRFCWRVVGLALMQDTPSKEIHFLGPTDNNWSRRNKGRFSSTARRGKSNKRNIFKRHTDLTDLIDFFCPAEIKEIAEMSPSENVVEIIMRSQNFLYFFYFCGTKKEAGKEGPCTAS